MLRLIHQQTVQGAILVDDIDDGLPNKTAHRLGSESDPKAYAKDGYANKPKQPCYVPLTKPHFPAVKGYIDLHETQRVLHSSGKGKIQGLARAGLISVVSFQETDLATPAITVAQIDVPLAGDLSITGTKLLSLTPDMSSVVLSGNVTFNLTQKTITDAGGTFGELGIVIPSILIPGIAVTLTKVNVVADDKTSNQIAVTA